MLKYCSKKVGPCQNGVLTPYYAVSIATGNNFLANGHQIGLNCRNRCYNNNNFFLKHALIL